LKLDNHKFEVEIAEECTISHVKAQKFSRGDTPGPPPLEVPPQTPGRGKEKRGEAGGEVAQSVGYAAYQS